MRNLVLLLWFVVSAGMVAAQELPVSGNPDRLGFEPDLILTGPPSGEAGPSGVATPGTDLAKLEAALERAKRLAASFERLFKAGAAARVEMERTALKVIVITKDIAVAKSTAAKTELEELKAKSATGEAGAGALKAAAEAAAAAEEIAQREIATCAKAQMDAAELNLYRWQKLLTVGAARKADVARAQEQLAALQRSQTASPAP